MSSVLKVCGLWGLWVQASGFMEFRVLAVFCRCSSQNCTFAGLELSRDPSKKQKSSFHQHNGFARLCVIISSFHLAESIPVTTQSLFGINVAYCAGLVIQCHGRQQAFNP